jgi:group I intron endonuclease
MILTGIYKILNKINNKVYIGSATDIRKRWRDHKWYLNHNIHHNSHLQSSWNKYGVEAFEFTILLECSIDELLEKEKEYTLKYNSLNNNCGYNVNEPQKVFLNRKCSELTKKISSKRMLGKNNPMFGKFGIEHPKFNISPSIKMRNHLSLIKKGIPTHRRTHVKLIPNDIINIRKMYNEEKISQPKIAVKYNVCCTTINQIINNKIWADVK